MIICEKVIIDYATDEETEYLVQYDDADASDTTSRDACLAYLTDCGHEISRQRFPVQDINGDPCVSWGDLSDLIEPRDD